MNKDDNQNKTTKQDNDDKDDENITVSITGSTRNSNEDDAYLSLKNDNDDNDNDNYKEPIGLKTMPLTDRDLKRMKEILDEEETLYQNPLMLTHPKKLGNIYAYWYIGNWPLITIGPDYCFPIVLFSITISVFILVASTVFRNNFEIARYIETIAFSVHIISYSLTVLINPGIPSPEHYTKLNKAYMEKAKQKKIIADNPYIKCSKCNIVVLRQENIAHCKICNVCVKGHDHHCPWTGKCIGKNNLFFFGIFVISTVFFFFASFLTFILFVSKNTKH